MEFSEVKKQLLSMGFSHRVETDDWGDDEHIFENSEHGICLTHVTLEYVLLYDDEPVVRLKLGPVDKGGTLRMMNMIRNKIRSNKIKKVLK